MTRQSVLIVDDEPDIRELLEITLSRMGLDTYSACDLAEARLRIDATQPDLCLTDMRLPDGNGISLVEHIQAEYPHIPVAMITAHGSVETAILALKAGAFDFISKPIELERLRGLVTSALQLEGGGPGIPFPMERELIGESLAIRDLRRQISKLARSQAPVHIRGESGSGKEVVARLIHKNGPRAAGAFVGVNCGAIPSELMESELFGHVKGAFTGAHQDKIGLFQAAAGGTLFLDEVADLPLDMQVKLLRAIQEKSVRPVGSSTEQATDVRLVSATHKNLAGEVDAGRFRNDLFYRINVIEVAVPSLRERLEDLPLLSEAIMRRINGSDAIAPTLSADAIETLARYDFPGNVRELENILERALALSDGAAITGADLVFPSSTPRMPAPTLSDANPAPREQSADWTASDAFGDLEGYLDGIEGKALTAALEQTRWNKTAAAKLLGISFRSLRYRLKKLGLDD